MSDVTPPAELPSFDQFNLSSSILKATDHLGFKHATPIQAAVLQHCIEGNDLLGQAQTGTGKTAAFLISSLQQLLTTPPPEERYLGEPRLVVIAPTRELVLQIAKDAKGLTQFADMHIVTLVGGMDAEKQKKALQRAYTDILVATPGRLNDFVQRREVHLDLTETLVIDEADRMLDLGFIPQIRRIISRMPKRGDRQTLMFSATFTYDVLELSKQWMWHPEQVRIVPDKVANENVDQRFYMVTESQKYPLLRNLLQERDEKAQSIIFANRRDIVRKLYEKLKKDGQNVTYISGDVPQNKRLQSLDRFKQNKVSVLVATDVAGRGLHIEGLDLVVNYTLPEVADDYIHRIGRTGRAGQKGVSVSFVSEYDGYQIPELEKYLGEEITCTLPPEDLLTTP